MKRRTRSLLIFSITLVMLGAAGAIAYQRLRSGMTDLQLEAPEDVQDALIAAYLSANQEKLEQPAGSDPTPIEFEIEAGESLNAIANRLAQAGLIGDTELFRRYLQYNRLDQGIEAGNFTLNKAMTIPQIAQALQEGRREELTLTVPEGKRLEEVAQIVGSQIPQIDANEFSLLASDASLWKSQFSFLSDIPEGGSLEGYLFPDTYRLPLETDARDVMTRMLRNFDAQVTAQMRADAQASGRSLWDVIRLASIVEREAVVAEERPLIAGVYLNRLAQGMALDADPTIQYALGQSREPGNWWPQLTLEDYQGVAAPYNTYLNPGLPPGPIASAGRGSIEAVIYPEQTDFFFFRASCSRDGTHQFARTLEEHAANECP
ncbi:MAG TPA: endolytic transglycosylase MltG [Anaerolineae bacterium]|nr:endolytic transglycosylase MltG [Anaerolineae bacterium]